MREDERDMDNTLIELIDADGRIVIGIYIFIYLQMTNAWTICRDTWPLDSIFCLMDIMRHAASLRQTVSHQNHQIQGKWDTQSRCQSLTCPNLVVWTWLHLLHQKCLCCHGRSLWQQVCFLAHTPTWNTFSLIKVPFGCRPQKHLPGPGMGRPTLALKVKIYLKCC